MSFRSVFFSLLAGIAAAFADAPRALAQETPPVAETEPLRRSDLSEEPFRHNGRIVIGQPIQGVGSGFVVDRRVVVTAGHVALDEGQLAPATPLHFRYRYHRPGTIFETIGRMDGIILYTDYASRVEVDQGNPDIGPGQSSIDTFNLDAAVLWRDSDIDVNEFQVPDRVTEWTGYWWREDDAHPLHYGERTKTIVGYPSGIQQSGNVGLMHWTPQGDYFMSGIGTVFGDVDSGGLDWALSVTSDATTAGGNSGGALYTEVLAGEWMATSILVGSAQLNDGSQLSILRDIDATLHDLILQAKDLSGHTAVRQADDFAAELGADGASIELSWTESMTGESGFRIIRRARARTLEPNPWEVVAELPANATSWTDTNVEADTHYRYRLQTLSDGGPTPFSTAQKVLVPGPISIGEALDAPDLLWTVGGDVPWTGQAEESFDGVDAARPVFIDNLEEAILETTVTGPGELSFYWRSSSEDCGPDCGDFLRFLVNGQEFAKLHGESAWEQVIVELPAGMQTLRWMFTKDPFAEDFQDTGFVDQVVFDDGTGPTSLFPEAEQLGEGWVRSWFGTLNENFSPILFHQAHGFVAAQGSATGFYWYDFALQRWFFTRSDVYPFIYEFANGRWLFFFENSQTPERLFGFAETVLTEAEL